MSARRFVVWEPGCTDEQFGMVTDTVEDEFEAAEVYAQYDYDNGNYEAKQDGYDVRVRCPTGEVVDIEVTVDWSPEFHAWPAKAAP